MERFQENAKPAGNRQRADQLYGKKGHRRFMLPENRKRRKGKGMKYLLKHKGLKTKYEREMAGIIQRQKYRIQRIDVFTELPDPLYPFHDCSVLLNVPVTPVSFTECESNNKLLGVEMLAENKKAYDEAKYAWVKKHCTSDKVSAGENFQMLCAIQRATLPFGIFTAAFSCHRLHDGMIKSIHSKEDIPYAPILFDTEDIGGNASDYFCHILAEKMDDVEDRKKYHQMNVYLDNVLTENDINDIYALIKTLMNKYNEYATTVYHKYKDSPVYLHRDDLPKN